MIPHDSKKWGVHVHGPDTVCAAIDFHQACEKVHQINESMRLRQYSKEMCEFYPVIFANVFIWDGSCGEHDPEKTNWYDLG